MRETMTVKERWLAAIHMKPVDRLPFWPKLGGAYPKAQPEPFAAMDTLALHRWIGSDPHAGIGTGLKERRTRTAVETAMVGEERVTTYTTPYGILRERHRYDGPSNSWAPIEHPVKTREDIALMTAVYEDLSVDLDRAQMQTSWERARALGQDAVTHASIGTSPLMQWIEWVAGIVEGHCLLTDHPDEVEELFEAMQRVLLRTTELLCEHSPADLLYLTENTSTTLISPAQYRRYCARHVEDCGRIVQQAGRPFILHMCGHLKALLPDLARMPAQAFEAFTAPPLGDTTLLDGRTACPDKCLIGGTHAMLWLEPAEKIIERIERDLDGLPHWRGIVVTSAGVMPPACRPETIRRVCEAVKALPFRA